MTRYAVKFSSTFGQPLVDKMGRPGGEQSGGTLLRRLLKLFPDPILVMPDQWAQVLRYDTDGWRFEPRTLAQLDPNDTVLINMDVLDSPDVYRQLRRDSWRNRPRIVNFVWWNVSEFTDRVDRAMIGTSAKLFPTFCNSARTEDEIRDVIAETTGGLGRWEAKVASCNLGVEIKVRFPPRPLAKKVVAYPAMWLFARKRPDLFERIVAPVAFRGDVEVRVRLATAHVRHPTATRWEHLGWSVLPLQARIDYEQELVEADVFVATALDESYGLQYAELMLGGAVGVFPDRPWIDTLLPRGYPFVYRSAEEGTRLVRALLDAPRAGSDVMVDVREKLARDHRPETFDKVFKETVEEWTKVSE